MAVPIEPHFVDSNHDELYAESINNPERFWGTLAKERLRWMKDFHTVMDCDMNIGKISWFLGGKLNVSDNCLDLQVERNPDRIAFIWDKDEPGTQETITYKQMLEMTCQVANTFKQYGIVKGDRVAIYMPMSPLLAASMLACARIGAIHSVVFAGFSAEALKNRILDATCKAVVTADQGVRGGKIIELKRTVDVAVAECDCIENVFVMSRTGAEVPMQSGRDIKLEEVMRQQSKECIPEPLDSEDPLFMLYTSGSTGKPKGLVHTQAGYLLYAGMTQQYVFDYQVGDVFACVADIGWITGHTYVVYGPLSNGATSVMFESTPTYPNAGRYWETTDRLKINQLYTAPTAIRLLIKCGNEHVNKYKRDTLRVLGCVGEPLNSEAWQWYHAVAGGERCTVVDTWFQTETGGIAITPRPSSDHSKPKPGFPMSPFFGIEPVLYSKEGDLMTGNNVSGHLCLRKPFPGMARTIYGDHQRFRDTYYNAHPGVYFSGDGAFRDDDGHYQITGRVDDVINAKGHRLGTAEVESAMNLDPRIAESAVVGYPHEIFGEGVFAFLILKNGVTDDDKVIFEALEKLVRKMIAAFAVPNVFLVVPGLPKTRSGKIMRRILRKIAASQYDELGDVSTLANPSIVEEIKAKHMLMTEEQ